MTTVPGDLSDLRLAPDPGHPLLRIESQMSEHVETIERAILAWADGFTLLDSERSRDRLARTRLGELVARSYPKIDISRVHAVAGWFTWAFVIDDCYDNPVGHYDETTERILRLLTPDATLAAASTPLDALLAEVWHQLAANRSVHWRMRFTQHMAHFLAAFKYESLNRQHGHTPDLLAYTQLRRSSGGITPSLDLLEVAIDQEVQPLLHETEQLRTMYNRAADVVVWVNDIVSLPKELVAGETTNGVLVLAYDQGLDVQGGIDAVYGLVARQVREFDTARREFDKLARGWLGLRPDELSAAASFIDGMRSWMRGNLDWSDHCDRYRVADGVRLSTDVTLVAPPP